MCGISGFVTTNKNKGQDLVDSLNVTSHRGPDNQSTLVEDYKDYFIGLGHNRLSILDLDQRSNQPMTSKCGNFTIVFNGEIYNYKELVEELNFPSLRTLSDTEVLLEYFARFGKGSLFRLNGMFSLAIYSKNENKMYLMRDGLGIKPIYYYHSKLDSEFYFSSEIKGLKPFIGKLEIDSSKILEFLLTGFNFEPYTAFNGIQKIRPGHLIEYDCTRHEISQENFQNFDYSKNNQSRDFISTIENSIKNQSNADVKIGTFFSGGIDSTVIAGSTDFDCIYVNTNRKKGSQDALYVEKYSKLCSNEIITIQEVEDKRNSLEKIKYVADNTEELISDITFISTDKICSYARTSNYKVMLSGMGADEIFLGYPRHRLGRKHQILKKFSKLIKLPFVEKILKKQLPNKFDRLKTFLTESNFVLAYLGLTGYYSLEELNKLLTPEVYEKGYNHFLKTKKQIDKKIETGQSLERTMLDIDLLGFLPHNLMITDKASMKNSIEVRVPFLDNTIITRIFNSRNFKAIKNKKPLKRYLEILNLKEFGKRKKEGFNPDLNILIDSIDDNHLREIIKYSKPLNKYFNTTYLMEILNNHIEGTKNNSYQIWQILYLHFWVENIEN